MRVIKTDVQTNHQTVFLHFCNVDYLQWNVRICSWNFYSYSENSFNSNVWLIRNTECRIFNRFLLNISFDIIWRSRVCVLFSWKNLLSIALVYSHSLVVFDVREREREMETRENVVVIFHRTSILLIVLSSSWTKNICHASFHHFIEVIFLFDNDDPCITNTTNRYFGVIE